MPLTDSLHRIVTERLDSRALALARIGVGLAAVLRGILGWRILASVFEPGRCTMPLFDWMPTPTPAEVPWIVALWIGAALFFLLGCGTRLAGAVLVAVIGYILALDQQLFGNHLYLLLLLSGLLTVAECSNVWSVDAWLRPGPKTTLRWPALLLQWQLSIVYGFAAVSKINSVYLSGAILSGNLRSEGFGAVPESWHTAAVMAPVALVAILLELFLATAFWSARFRRLAVLAGLMLHLGIMASMALAVFGELLVFMLEMVALYPLFFFPAMMALSPPSTPTMAQVDSRSGPLNFAGPLGFAEEELIPGNVPQGLDVRAATRSLKACMMIGAASELQLLTSPYCDFSRP